MPARRDASPAIPFARYPRSVRYALILMVASWSFSLTAQALFTGTVALLPVTLALVSCVVAFSLRPWGRIFCVGVNVLMVSVHLSSLAMQASGTAMDLIRALSACLFALAGIFLLLPGTRAFYLSQASASDS